MFAQCPQCEAVFQVSDELLAAANGDVRCGQCLTIFNAPQHERQDLLRKHAPLSSDADEDRQDEPELFDSEPEPEITRAEDISTIPPPLISDEIDYAEPVSQSSKAAASTDGAVVEEAEWSAQPEAVEQTREPEISAPSATQPVTREAVANPVESMTPEPMEIPAVLREEVHAEHADRRHSARFLWLSGSLLLVLVLAGQVIYLQRNDLARDPQLRPWLTQACALLNCRIAPAYDIGQIKLQGLEVHTHPEYAHALVASTALINTAEITQPYPLLMLTFSDINGYRVAQRNFLPEEYLPLNTDLDQGMNPNQAVKIVLEITDPGPAAVNFEFHIRFDPRRQVTSPKLKNPLGHLLSEL